MSNQKQTLYDLFLSVEAGEMSAEEALTKAVDWLSLPSVEVRAYDENTTNIETCPPGLYKIHWRSGGTSLGSVYQDGAGTRHFVPVNWISGPAELTEETVKTITRLTPIEIEVR